METPTRDDIFTAVRSPNPLEETMERIAGAIKSRLLSPGDRLPAERELALQLGVSRSTLRVALQNLVNAGWLEVRRGRHGGSFVARWPPTPERRLPDLLTKQREDLPGLLDYRTAVESAAAAFAAERASAEDLAELLELNAAIIGQEGNYEAYRAADARFHIGIARAAHSPRLMQAVTEVQAAITEVLDAIAYHSQEVLTHSTDYHKLILAAISARQPDTARQAMLDHVSATEKLIYSMLPDLERTHEP